MERLSTALIANAFRSDMPERDLSLADRSFVAVMTLIYNTHNWQFCLKYVPLLMLEFPKTYAISLEKRTIIQSGLFTLTHVPHLLRQACLLTLEAKKQTNLSDEILSSVFNTVIGHFKAINDVTADGIYLLGTLSSFKKVPAYLESVWPYIKHSLAKYNEQTMFKAALGALVDLARNNSQAFGQEPYINIMVDLLKAVKVPSHIYVGLRNRQGTQTVDLLLHRRHHHLRQWLAATGGLPEGTDGRPSHGLPRLDPHHGQRTRVRLKPEADYGGHHDLRHPHPLV